MCVRECVCVSGSFSLGDGNFCERQRLPIATAFIVKLILGIQHTHTRTHTHTHTHWHHACTEKYFQYFSALSGFEITRTSHTHSLSKR